MKKVILLSFFLLLLFTSIGLADVISIPFQKAKNQPYFASPELTIDSAEYNTIILKIKSEQRGIARIYWVNVYDMQFNIQKSIQFSLKSGSHSYYISIPSQNPNWFGWTKQILINPETPGLTWKVEDIEITTGSFITNILSGWQEFWKPRGRVVIGSTINVTPSSTIWGRSINIYMYLIIGLSFLIFWVRSFSLTKAAEKTFTIIILIWILLTLNANYNYFNIFKNNYTKYFGKSIENKHAKAYGRDYYDFLRFAKLKLPQKKATLGILSSLFAPGLQARIYLIPNVLISPEKNPDYLLIFNQAKDQSYNKNMYKIHEKYKTGQYIVKRRK